MNVNFYDPAVWSAILLTATLLVSMIVAYILKKTIPAIRKSLIPPSVLGGLFLLAASTICKLTSGEYLFNISLFSSGFKISGNSVLELITYHCLAIGFICMSLRTTEKKLGTKRASEVFNTGITTVSTYLLQAVLGLIITIAASAAAFGQGVIPAAGILLAFGFGQGTGQALNFGKAYESDYGFEGGSAFGLTVAAIGFLTATVVGVAYLNYLRRRNKLPSASDYGGDHDDAGQSVVIDDAMTSESMDSFTIQIGLITLIYTVTYGLMSALSLAGMKSTFFGFNFLIAVLVTIPVKAIIMKIQRRTEKAGKKKKIISNYLMNRIGGFAFDLMIVAGIAAIRIDLIADYWLILLIMFIAGASSTFIYVYFVCKKLFPAYLYEQFLAMFGMLTGTASTGIILLREIDRNLDTPASENLVYQNIPAIAFGFPLMLFAGFAPKGMTESIITLGACVLFFIAMNLILFRKSIFGRKSSK
jgi:ESS family glutamate:Na+ symporter